MNILDVQKFFNTMLSEAVIYPERAALFRSLGFDPESWPECPSKQLMIEFDSLRREKGEDYARFSLVPKIRALEAHEELPQDQGELTLGFDRAKTFGQALQLAERIRERPLDLEQHIDDYRRKRSNKVETFLVHEAIDETLSEQEKNIEKNEIRVLIPGWEKLSKKIGGFNPGRVSMLVAKTGVGKTMLALNLIDCASEFMPCLFFNMEMSKKDIMSRMIQSGAKIKSEDWYAGNWNFPGIGDFRERTAKRKPIMMTDGRALTLNQIIGQIIIAREKYGIQFVGIDYDQKIRLSSREEEWRAVQRAVEDLEECAKSIGVHIMVLAQGDDDGEVKSSKRAQQPASTIFEFVENNGTYSLKSKKNRFGARRWRMKVNCDPSMSVVSEGEIIDETQLEPKGRDPLDSWYNKDL